MNTQIAKSALSTTLYVEGGATKPTGIMCVLALYYLEFGNVVGF